MLTKETVYKVISKEVLKELVKHFRLDINGVHGFGHWSRVIENAVDVAKSTGGSINVAIAFGFFHDIERYHDGDDPEHGGRAADLLIRSYSQSLGLTEGEFKDLCDACSDHNLIKSSENKNVGLCWDGDRLDLYRSQVIPLEGFLSCEYTRQEEVIAQGMNRSLSELPKWATEIKSQLDIA